VFDSELVLPIVTATDGGGCERAFTCLVVAECRSSDCCYWLSCLQSALRWSARCHEKDRICELN